MMPGTAIECWIMLRLLARPVLLSGCPGGVHPFPAPRVTKEDGKPEPFFVEFRYLSGADDSNFCGAVTESDMSYEVVAMGDTGTRGYGPLAKFQQEINTALAVGDITEAGTVTEFGTLPAIHVQRVEEIREPELLPGGKMRRRLGAVYRFRVTPEY